MDVFVVSQIPTPNPLTATYQLGPSQPAPTSASGQLSPSVGTTPQSVNINITGIYPSLGGIQPQLRNDPGTGSLVITPAPAVTNSSSTPTQMQIIDGVIELWVGATDGLVRAAHLRLNLPSAREDCPGRLEPGWQDTWVWCSEINEPFTMYGAGEPRAAHTAASIGHGDCSGDGRGDRDERSKAKVREKLR